MNESFVVWSFWSEIYLLLEFLFIYNNNVLYNVFLNGNTYFFLENIAFDKNSSDKMCNGIKSMKFMFEKKILNFSRKQLLYT